jgi:hypothetical protein
MNCTEYACKNNKSFLYLQYFYTKKMPFFSKLMFFKESDFGKVLEGIVDLV